MAAPPTAPPSYNESMQQSSGFQGYQPTYGSVGAQQAGAYPPGPAMYPPQGAYDANKPAGAYMPGPYPPQPPYPPQGTYPSHPGMIPPYGQTGQSHQTNVVVQPTQSVVVVGGCPACRVGVLEEDFTCLGVVCAIIFFPIGILCCLAMRQRRCSNCGAVFG